MSGLDLFGLGLLALGWIVFQVLRRVLRPPRSLGTISDELPPEAAQPQQRAPHSPMPEAPLDTGWGRAPAPPVHELPPPAPREALRWAVDAAPSELKSMRDVTRRAAPPRVQQMGREIVRPHPHYPRLRTAHDLRDAMVLAAVLGRCRALESWEPPEPLR